jgi:hypothetical protein
MTQLPGGQRRTARRTAANDLARAPAPRPPARTTTTQPAPPAAPPPGAATAAKRAGALRAEAARVIALLPPPTPGQLRKLARIWPPRTHH